MLSQLVRSNAVSTKNLKTKATRYSSVFKAAMENRSDELDKLAQYTKLQINEQQPENNCENKEDFICEDPEEFVVKLSDIYKEKEEKLPFFKSIQSQLHAIYG